MRHDTVRHLLGDHGATAAPRAVRGVDEHQPYRVTCRAARKSDGREAGRRLAPGARTNEVVQSGESKGLGSDQAALFRGVNEIAELSK